MSFASFDLEELHVGDRVSFINPITGTPTNGNITSITSKTVNLTVDSGGTLFMTPHQISLTKLTSGGKKRKSRKTNRKSRKSSRKKKKSRRRR